MSDYQGNIVIKNPATPAGPYETGAAPGVWRLSEVLPFVRQGVWPTPGIAAPDTYFPYVSLLLSTTSLGNANNNLFVDSSGAFNPVSRFGNTTQGSFTPYATNWSNYFDGSGDYLTVPSNSALAFGTGDFTIEFWTYRISGANTDNFIISSASSGGFFFGTKSNGWGYGSTGNFWSYNTGVIPALNTWQHVAVSRSGSSLRIFVDGTQIGTTQTDSSDWSLATGGTTIGSQGASYYYNGYISNLRVLKGTALYTSNFTVPTAPLTAISGTSLLTCQSNRFIDNSSNAFTITVNGNTSVQDFNPFSPAYPGLTGYNQSDITNWSGYFDGSGDYLTVPYSTALQLPGDFTIETWVYLNSRVTSFPCIVANYSTYAANGGFALFAGHNFNTTKYTVSFNGSFPVLTSSSSIAYGVWTHLAVVRSGSTLTLYVNGVSEATATNSATVTGTSDNWWIATSGDSTTSSYINGSISNLRVVKGTAVYTGNFTPPTSALTAISGTSLLTCQNAAFTDNSTNKFVITQNGNPTVSGNAPFNTVGYWSNYFDGSGDYLYAPNNTALDIWDNGTGSFTVEAWIFATSSISNNVSIVGKATLDGNIPFDGWVFQVFSGYLNVNTANNNRLFTNTTAVPLNQWVHVALVKSGTTVSIYQNGTRVSTITSSTAYSNTTDQLHIATDRNPGGSTFPGYISNLRMVKGTAVYDPSQASITVPTTPLTAVTNTSLLTCQNGRFIDNSTNAFAITAYGNTSTQSFDPFYTSTIASNGGSIYFDGSGDYLRGVSGPAFALGSGDFTVEMWAYFLDTSGTNKPMFDTGVTTNTGRLLIRQGDNGSTANVVNAFLSGTTAGSPTFNFNQWTHVAVVRSSGTLKVYINGVGGTGVSATANLTENACLLGQFYDFASNFYGYMSNVRVTKGTAIYTANFTPPTAPLTPSASTTLLVNGMNAGIYDATTINDMETVGNAQVSTVQSKFGGSSMYFDGTTSNRIKPPASPIFAFGTGNFTVEAWVYVTNMTTENFVFDTRSSVSTAGMGFSLEPNTGKLRYSGNANNVLTSTAVSANTWTHVAWVRNGSTLTGYINGVAGGSASNSDNLTQTNGEVGNVPFSAVGTNMYIDEVRVTRGVARYTANFTPPTQAFPTY